MLWLILACSVPMPPPAAVDPHLGSEVPVGVQQPSGLVDAAQCHAESEPDRPCRLVRRLPASAGVVECWCWRLDAVEPSE